MIDLILSFVFLILPVALAVDFVLDYDNSESYLVRIRRYFVKKYPNRYKEGIKK